MERQDQGALGEWRRHAAIPLVSALALMISVTHLYSIGAFIPALEREFGWSRTQVSSGLTILSVLSVCLAPFVGAAIDRFGSRRIGLPGVAIYCAAIAGLSLAGPSIWSWWALWLPVGVGSLCIKPTVWAAAISSRFTAGRGFAISIALAGVGLGSAAYPLVAVTLAETQGWRSAYLLMAVIDAAVVLPLVWWFFYDSHDRRRGSTAQRVLLPGLTLGAALRSTRFGRLALVSLLFTVATTAMIVHFVPILVETGLTPVQAGATAGLVGIGSVAGRLGTGLLLDRFHGPYVGIAAFVLPIAVCVLLATGPGPALAAAVALMIGLSLGAEVDVVSYLATRYFGMRHFGVVFGTMAGLQSLGAGLGPLLSGYLHDTSGSYALLPWIALPMFAISGVAVGTLGRYPVFGERD